jgi:hypothetical protein
VTDEHRLVFLTLGVEGGTVKRVAVNVGVNSRILTEKDKRTVIMMTVNAPSMFSTVDTTEASRCLFPRKLNSNAQA